MEPPSNLLLLINLSPIEQGLIVTLMLILFYLSAVFSGAEAALLALTTSDLEQLRSKLTQKNQLILKLLTKPNHFLCSLLLGNSFANLSIVFLSTRLFTDCLVGYTTVHIIIGVTVMLLAILIFGEITPKLWGKRYAGLFLSKFAYTLQISFYLCKPFTFLMVRSFAGIRKHLRADGRSLTFDELTEAIAYGHNQSVEAKQMLKAIVQATNTEVRDIFCPRMDISAISYHLNFEEVCQAIVQCGYSRIPIFKNKLDDIVGILNVKDFLPYIHTHPADFNWQQLIRPAHFVNENKRINDLLTEFQQKKVHLAIVVNEYGETTGLIALEDILEEIVGEILDETDIELDELYTVKDGVYIFEGKTAIKDFCSVMCLVPTYFDAYKGESESLAGLLLQVKGDLFSLNEQIQIANFDFEVLELGKNRIVKIKVTKQDAHNKQ